MSSRRDLVGALTALLRLIGKAATLNEITRATTYSRAVAIANRANRGLIDQLPWTPFEKVSRQPLSESMITAMMKQGACDRTTAIARLDESLSGTTYVNSRYQVLVRDFGIDGVHLSIKRIDQLPIHDWRDLQQIKNALVGEDCEAVELYPATDRVLDASNQYHLWAVRDASYRFPVGFEHGGITDSDAAEAIGAAQREPIKG